MKLNLYFDQDKIIGQGGVVISIDDILPKEVYSGIDIVREYDNTHYYISLNIYIKWEVFKIYNDAHPGFKNRIYELIGTHEPIAVAQLLKNELANDPVNDPVNNYQGLWKDIMAHGVYSQTGVKKDIILDKAVYDGVLEYDNNGYYSVAYSFVERIKQKKTYSLPDAVKIIQCSDDALTIHFFENIGYVWKNGKLIRGKDNDKLFE